MQTIQFKNKRGKAIITLQWERPEDLISWAESMSLQNGFEFRNVDADIPVTLKGSDAPAHKLKLVVKDIQLKSHSDVQEALMSMLENLQEEFEALMCRSFVNEKTLDDKKNQISTVNDVITWVENQQISEEGFRVKMIPQRADKPLFGLTKLLQSGLKFKNTISIKEAMK